MCLFAGASQDDPVAATLPALVTNVDVDGYRPNPEETCDGQPPVAAVNEQAPIAADGDANLAFCRR